MINKFTTSAGTQTHTICVDMHCHSSYSDGVLSPAQIAKNLSEAGAKFAALTDHNTLAGQKEFSSELEKYDIGYISGVEITTKHNDYVLHMLAYGFDPESPELGTLFEKKVNTTAEEFMELKVYLTSSEIISLIHRAGGVAILAHPHLTEPDFERMLVLVDELKKKQIDGIEAIYGQSTDELNQKLVKAALQRDLVPTAGTDYHDPAEQKPGMVIDMEHWKAFRDALIKTPLAKEAASLRPEPKKKKNRWFSFAINIFLPAFLSLVLFTGALFIFLLPYFESTLMDKKREEIRQLTQVAWGVLNEAYEEEQSGQMTLEQAQGLAKERISALRYGVDNKDYFWLQDTTPRILMHPYREDLNNHDVTDFKDEQGTRIFVEFSNLALEKGEGYVNYIWQWMDDPDRLEPKESYIRYFKPWGWVIGTGVYTSDVHAEILKLQRYIVIISSAVIGVVLLLLVYMIRQGLLLEKSKREASRLLKESTQRYKALSEAATEGALFVSGGRCRYANAVMYELLGCNSNRIDLLYLNDVFPEVKENKEWLAYVSEGVGSDGTDIIKGVIRRCSGDLLSCELTVKKSAGEQDSGMMILIKRSDDVGRHTGTQAALGRLLNIPGSIAIDLADSIKKASKASEVVVICKKTSGTVASLLENGTSSIAIAHMISTITDLATQRFIELGIDEIGTAPAPFAFLALGSQGRQAQTLLSDQDNALIYLPDSEKDEKTVRDYFLKLASIVCDNLELAGYPKCEGGMTASNPKWCKPLKVWKSYFKKWIKETEPQQIVEFSIMFDYRTVYGDNELSAELRDYIFSEINGEKYFSKQVAQNAVTFKTPLRLFGNIKSSSGAGIDVKTPAIAIICFSRLYSIRHSVSESNTLLQLDRIKSLGIISDARHRDTVTAYEMLLRLRLWNQVLETQHNERLDNYIDPDRLGSMEKVLLRESFKEIDELQSMIERDFLSLV